MAIVVGPTIVTRSYPLQAGVAGGDRAASSDPGIGPVALTGSAPQNIQSIQRVGSVVVQPGTNTTVPLGGRFDVWYDLASHSLIIDIASVNIGGPA